MKRPSLRGLNGAQRRILDAWPTLLWDFLKREWWKGAVGYATGVLFATLGIFGLRYSNTHPTWPLGDQRLAIYRKIADSYLPNLLFILVPLALVALFQIGMVAWRATRSWIRGVTSGAFVLSFAIALASSWNLSGLTANRGWAALVESYAAILVAFVLRTFAQVEQVRTLDAKVKTPSRANVGETMARDQESPIGSWAEDRLDRSSLVEMLTLKILVSKVPVIALRGNFGDGKSSVLNLLRSEIGTTAIVVSFSSWLPDSQQTLVRDLFGDIATEVNKCYFVPGLRKKLVKLASLLGGAVHYLKILPEFLPPYTQRQEIRDLGEVFGRIPKRVVVLLDEIDRMQKDELLVLLKIIRGVPALPNFTFVCAFQQEEFERKVCDCYDSSSHEFMEKFFPTAIDLPKPNAQALERMFRDRIMESFETANWFQSAQEREEFLKRLGELWSKALGLVITNIRKIGLIANDLHGAAVLVRREVDPLDLSALEVVRRFYPKAYDLIWKNPEFFCNSDQWWKSRRFQTEENRSAQSQAVAAAVKDLSGEGNAGAAIYPLLISMFPTTEIDLLGTSPRMARDDRFSVENEKAKRISHPDYFPVYFCREVPESSFGASELDGLIEKLGLAGSDAEREAIFSLRLRDLAKGSLRRYDFIHKIGLALEELPMNIAQPIGFGIAANSEILGSDFLVSEMRRGVGAVLAVAQRLSDTTRINTYVSRCIDVAGADLFAAEVYVLMTTTKKRNKVVTNFTYVREPEISAAFAARMNRRYGPDADIVSIDLRSIQISAFFQWASINSSERDTEISFWKRYVDGSQRRLAEVFNVLVPPGTMWQSDSGNFIDQILPREILKEMYEEPGQTEPLESLHKDALDRLRRFLAGELRDGEIIRGTNPVSVETP